ncbi:MAG: hypothetical protein GVY12_15480, partial [Bacteroidetes bacterium]|nr:hypothetical protein [Bacteroidota bacterium]
MRNFTLSCVIALITACALLTASALLTACSDDPTSDVPAPTPDPIEVSVEGTVADTSGAAVAGAAVAVYPGGSDSALDETATGEDGTYALSFAVEEDEAPGALRLTFEAGGYAPEEATVDFTESITYNAALTPEATDDDGDDDNGDDPAEATVSGTVSDAASDDPIQGATITGTTGDDELFSATTAADGTYEATFTVGEEPDELTVTASANEYEDAEETVSFAEEMTVGFQLEPVDTSTEATISGTVTDASNDEPIEGATITGAAGGEELFSTTTGSDGTYGATFTVEDEPTEITLTASAAGYEDAEETVAFAKEMTADFQLQPIDTSTEASISGTVTDEDTGDPIEGASITGAAGGAELFSTTTGSDGSYAATFTVEDEPTEITLTATADGYEEAQQPVAFAEDMTASFQLEPDLGEFTITATVVNAGGAPVEGITVSSDAPDLEGTTGPGGG